MMQRDRRKGGKAMWKKPATRRGRRASPLSCPNHDRTLPLSQRRCDDLGSIDSRLIPAAVVRYGMGRLFSAACFRYPQVTARCGQSMNWQA